MFPEYFILLTNLDTFLYTLLFKSLRSLIFVNIKCFIQQEHINFDQSNS